MHLCSKHIYSGPLMASCACVSYSLLLNPFSSDAGRHKRRPLLSQSDPSTSIAEKDPAWVICFFFLFCHHNRPRSISSRLPFPLFAPQLSALSMYHPFRFISPPPNYFREQKSLTELPNFSPLSQPLCCHIKIKLYPGEASCLTVGRSGGWRVDTFFSGVVFLPHGQRRQGDLQAELGDFGAAHPDGRLGNTRVHLVFVLGHSL